MSNKFPEHRESFFGVDGNIITVVMKGSFNEYGFKFTAKRIKCIVDTFQDKEFYILMNMLETIGGTPELYKEANKYNEWLNNQNMVAKAVVIKSRVTWDIYNARVIANKIQVNKVFDNEPDALKWLKDKSQQIALPKPDTGVAVCTKGSSGGSMRNGRAFKEVEHPDYPCLYNR